MNVSTLGIRNVRRNLWRTIGTIAGVAVALVSFILIQTVLDAWEVAAKNAAQDRIATRHKVSFIMTLPKKTADDIAQVPGVTKSMHMSWFGAKDPNHENEFFATMAVQSETLFAVYDECIVPEEQQKAWLETRNGAIVGDALAHKLGWKIGDKISLEGTIFPGTWDFTISGIYTVTRKSIDRNSLFFHYKYLNEALPPERQDQVGWIVSRIQDSSMAAQLSQDIDKRFDDDDQQTLTMSERALNTSFLGMFATVLEALNLVSAVILLIMMLILGNTIAMGVRERTHEYGVLRAIGFLPKHIAGFVFGEAMTIGVLGGIAGLGIAYPLIEFGMSRFIEENMGGIFPFFRIENATIAAAMLLSVVLGLVAAGFPAYRASKLDVVDSLRRLG